MRDDRQMRVGGPVDNRHDQTYTGPGFPTKLYERHHHEPVVMYAQGGQLPMYDKRFEVSRSNLIPKSTAASPHPDNIIREKPSTSLLNDNEMARYDKHPQEALVPRFDAINRGRQIAVQPIGYRNQREFIYQHPKQISPSVSPKATANSLGSVLQTRKHVCHEPDHHCSLATLPSMEQARFNLPQKKHMGPVIFLDIDGVVHPVQVTREYQLFRRDKMSLLRYLVQQTGACIVLSSAWRLAPRTMQIVSHQLVRHGLATFIDKTPDHGMSGKRSAEILQWVKQYQPSAWIAIDDIDLAHDEPRMRDHFLHTNSSIGLTAELCERGIRIIRAGVTLTAQQENSNIAVLHHHPSSVLQARGI